MKGLEHASSLHVGLDARCCVADFRQTALVEGFIWFFVGDGVPQDTLCDVLDEVLRMPMPGIFELKGDDDVPASAEQCVVKPGEEADFLAGVHVWDALSTCGPGLVG